MDRVSRVYLIESREAYALSEEFTEELLTIWAYTFKDMATAGCYDVSA